MSNRRDLDRMARTMVGQKLEEPYIRYYLMDTYQLNDQQIDEIFDRIGFKKIDKSGNAKAPPKPSRQGFY